MRVKATQKHVLEFKVYNGTLVYISKVNAIDKVLQSSMIFWYHPTKVAGDEK